MTRALLATVLLFSMSTVLHAQSPALTNADVTRLVAMRVSDQTVIAVIHEATATQFDLTELAISYLANSGVSTAVIAVMRQSAAPTPTKTIAAPAQSVHPQTLAEASASAKQVPHEWELSRNLGPPPASPLTAAELADINRSKFDKVHIAAAAATDALSLRGVAGKTEAVRTMREFKTEAGLAFEKAVTKAEKDLAHKYVDAQFNFEMSESYYALAMNGSSSLNKQSLDKAKEFSTQAWASFTAADKIYLGK